MRSALLAMVGIAAGLIACEPPPVDSDEPVNTGLSFEDDIEPMFTGCIGCHAGETPDGALLLTGDLYTVLLETDSAQADMRLVEPGDAMHSYVFHKINGTQSVAGGAGTRMPLGEPWADADIELLATWIDVGAER